ncbi:MAG: thiamine-phosphate kinase [Variibacter sp.]|nr:thiamine-phosphate kinase [Variibacter sp.]
MSAAAGESGEDRLIAHFFRPLATAPGALGLHDDAAFFSPPAGCDLVLTKDALVAGVHFFADDAPGVVAQKALRVNLSDLAAKGADPAGFLLAIALPAEVAPAWLAAFCEGLGRDAAAYGCPLYGGDTVRTPGPLTVSVTAFGTLPTGSMVHRAGAQSGDAVFVTGTIGDAALGLLLRTSADAPWGLSAQERAHLLDRYLLPQPRNPLAAAVRAHASAGMDVSDGLVGDFAKLCRESGVSAEIDVRLVPLSSAARKAVAADAAALDAALTGGDDYEILCTVPARRAEEFCAAARAANVTVTAIGTIVEGNGPPRFMHRGAAMQFASGSFSHF